MSQIAVLTKEHGIVSMNKSFDFMCSQLRNGRYKVTIERYTEPRSLSQNALMWLWFTCIEQETGTDKQDIHDYYCNMYLRRTAYFKGKEYVLELTGTPVVNNNTDLIQQLKIMGRLEDFGGYKSFVERYCGGQKQSSNVKELNWRLSQICFFRREKAKVLTQLPDKSRQYIEVDITNRKEYDKAEQDLIQYLKTYKDADDEKIAKALRGEVMVKMGILKYISAIGKIKVFSEFIHDVIDGGEKLIVFAYLKEVVMELKALFPDAVTVTGEDNAIQKQRAVDSFQNDPNCKLIILNYKSGGTGLTLTASSRVAFIEFPWTFSDCEQAEDRAHRNGQKNNVNCYYYLGKDTIDRYMYDVIQTKKNIANGVIGTDDVVKESIVDMAMNLFNQKL